MAFNDDRAHDASLERGHACLARPVSKGLERDGLVRRTAFATVPVTVEYAMTPLGETLVATVEALRLWSDAHIEEVRAARSRYDDCHAD